MEAFADTVIELAGHTEVFRVDRRKLMSGVDLFGHLTVSARVSVFGAAGIEQRWTQDLGGELLELRPDLQHAPRVPAVSIDGPISHDRTGPVYISITTATDLWFPRVVGIHDDPAEHRHQWLDNSVLARRHTPRFNAFLAGARDAVAALGGGWSCDVGVNVRYADWFDVAGVRLGQPGLLELLVRWSGRICTVRSTNAEAVAGELDLVEMRLVPRFGGFCIEPPPAGLREMRVIQREGRFARLDMQLNGSALTRGDLDAVFGVGVGAPRVHFDSFHTLTYRWNQPSALYGCEITAEFEGDPTADTPVTGLSMHRRDR
ncbi:hypothetical protein [Pseudonocardia sp. TRM90224]|uniref:hypothetical protein n=1 Tax=Pseudonocardia sp. TRM90224 TaxID=2812678 RepID=UPI001E653F86|nr:hypothetical protein [Pseudonocardia sp. TRM90224]